MYKFMFRQWKTRKAIVILIIFGFFIGSLVMSIGISVCAEAFRYVEDERQGNPEDQLDIYISYQDVYKEGEIESVVEKLGELGEVQILSMTGRKLDGKQESYSVVPVLFHKQPSWHIPIISGTYFDESDMDKMTKSIVIGKSIADKYGIKIGDYVSLQKKKFCVIGICGRQNRETSWEHAIYLSWKSYIELYPDSFQDFCEGNSMTIHMEKGKKRFVEEDYISFISGKGMSVTYKDVKGIDDSSYKNTVMITVIAVIMVFIIAIINIVHLMLYWLLERKREIGIIKALGASDGYITKCIVIEVLSMSTIGCLSAVMVQYLVTALLMNIIEQGQLIFEVGFLNLLCTIGVALLFGILAAVVPAKNAMSYEPVQIINM